MWRWEKNTENRLPRNTIEWKEWKVKVSLLLKTEMTQCQQLKASIVEDTEPYLRSLSREMCMSMAVIPVTSPKYIWDNQG